MVNEEKKKKQEPTKSDNETGDTPEEDEKLKRTNEANERLERNLAEARKAGITEAGAEEPEKEKETDEEFSKKVITGEINPLVEDGFV